MSEFQDLEEQLTDAISYQNFLREPLFFLVEYLARGRGIDRVTLCREFACHAVLAGKFTAAQALANMALGAHDALCDSGPAGTSSEDHQP